MSTSVSADDLSGRWDGIFNYPHGHGSNIFAATLRDAGGVLIGETSEASDGQNDSTATLVAWIEGRHIDHAVHFVKSYDDASRLLDPVFYGGTVSSDGLEIGGQWTIRGVWSGTFMMMRPGGVTAAVQRETADTVR